ncbi:hypothetical protein B0H17DRAFT_1195015 [Mycena rosella]|uniref:Uncharacterized protein n=1 Tax=Mycena rosella TaxID=1033263 RepID=A0AAD7GMB1_MYCRO|nr:hypothetical protein B0H17DRAFT_1195015 [Mycena rosella]
MSVHLFFLGVSDPPNAIVSRLSARPTSLSTPSSVYTAMPTRSYNFRTPLFLSMPPSIKTVPSRRSPILPLDAVLRRDCVAPSRLHSAGSSCGKSISSRRCPVAPASRGRLSFSPPPPTESPAERTTRVLVATPYSPESLPPVDASSPPHLYAPTLPPRRRSPRSSQSRTPSEDLETGTSGMQDGCAVQGWIDAGMAFPTPRRPGIPRPVLALPAGDDDGDQHHILPRHHHRLRSREDHGAKTKMSRCRRPPVVIFSSALTAAHADKAPDAHRHPLLLVSTATRAHADKACNIFYTSRPPPRHPSRPGARLPPVVACYAPMPTGH